MNTLDRGQLMHDLMLMRERVEKLEKRLNHERVCNEGLREKVTYLSKALTEERDAHRCEVDLLEYRLDGALEVCANLRKEHLIKEDIQQGVTDDQIDILATLVSLYPFTPDNDLAFEFGLTKNQVRELANIVGAVKSKDARNEAVAYLRKQNIELADRRGGADYVKKIPILKLGRNGKVIERYDTMNDAIQNTGMSIYIVRKLCRSKRRIYTKEGFTLRFDNQ